jgi:hypothetical protein
MDVAAGKPAPAPVVGPSSTVQDLARKLGGGLDEEAAALKLQLDMENAARLANRNTRVPPMKISTKDAGIASKSRGAKSGTPGLTRADLESVGLNPDLNYTGMAPDVIARIKAARAGRHTTHYANAQADKAYRGVKNDTLTALEQSLLERMKDRLR